MGRKSVKTKMAEVHDLAVSRFDTIYSKDWDEREQALSDRRFYSIAGAQWEGDLKNQFQNRPRFEVNKIHLSVIRIINEYRNNRITVDFVSKDGTAVGELADICDGLYRSDEHDSAAEEAYDNAFEEAVGGGFGAWRLRAEYEDEEDEENDKQRIILEPIYDADTTVFFDPQARRQDKKDAKYAFVLNPLSREEYENTYEDDPDGWNFERSENDFDWFVDDTVFVAEYYVRETESVTMQIWEDLQGNEEKIFPDDAEDGDLEILRARGSRMVKSRTIKKNRVRKYILSGGSVLEDCGFIAGQHIPIVPVYGKRWFVDNRERFMGHVRLAKDAQRLKNMQLSRLGELSALSPVEKPIMTPEQMAGHDNMWATDNVENFPYLLVNPVTDINGQEAIMGPVGYTKAPAIPPAMSALLQITEEDMGDLLGNRHEGEQIVGNVSTETAQIVQNRLDMQTYIYMSNMSKAMRRSGEIWLSMAKDVLVEEGRKMKSVDDRGGTSSVTLLQPLQDDNGKTYVANDLADANFDVWVNVGPSSSTSRAATVRTLTSMLKIIQDPSTSQVIAAMVMMNVEGEGVEDTRKYFRRQLIKMKAIEPTDEEAQALAKEAEAEKPSAQDQYFTAAAENEKAKSVKAQADVIEIQASADKKRAETTEILSDIETSKIRAALDVIEKLGPRVAPPDLSGSEVQE